MTEAIKIGDFVEDCSAGKGRVIALDNSRDSPAVIVKFTDGVERSVAVTYLRKLVK